MPTTLTQPHSTPLRRVSLCKPGQGHKRSILLLLLICLFFGTVLLLEAHEFHARMHLLMSVLCGMYQVPDFQQLLKSCRKYIHKPNIPAPRHQKCIMDDADVSVYSMQCALCTAIRNTFLAFRCPTLRLPGNIQNVTRQPSTDNGQMVVWP